MTVELRRAPARLPEPPPPPRWARTVLGAPLVAKLAGANVVLATAGIVAALAAGQAGASRGTELGLLVAFLSLALIVNLTLVHLALRPLKALEATALRVSRGDFEARVPRSPLTDRNLARVGDTFNRLLDGLVSDRARLRTLAAEVIRVGDAERARIARELHDSTAQTLAALKLQLAAMAHGDPTLAARLEPVVELATAALEEVRTLAHVVYPRVLDDLGLPAALQWLARQVSSDAEAPDTVVDVPEDASPLPLANESRAVLYRVAQEALRNAVLHAHARHITVRLAERDGGAELTVADDGSVFDVEAAERRRPGMGLFTRRERVGLVDGRLTIDSAPRRGTRIAAWVPGTGAPPAAADEAETSVARRSA